MPDKTTISDAETYQDIGDFWDKHDATEFGDQQGKAEFEVNIKSQRRYFSLDSHLVLQMRQIAGQHGVSEETLLNLWVQEKISQIQIAEKNKNLSQQAT